MLRSTNGNMNRPCSIAKRDKSVQSWMNNGTPPDHCDKALNPGQFNNTIIG